MFNDPGLIAFTAEQIRSCSMAMLEVAMANGIHPAELALIREFWSTAQPTLGELRPEAATPFNASLFADAPQRQTVLELSLACAFADGSYSDEEKPVIASIAQRLGFSAEALEECTANVRAAFLGGLSHLPDSQAVAALAKDLE